MMITRAMMEMWMKLLGPLPEAPNPEPVRHARICRCAKPGCNAPVRWNTERTVMGK